MSLRCFFALPLKPNVVRRLADHADSLCLLDNSGRMLWVDSDNYHLTLCFLGNVELETANQLETLATARLADAPSFQVNLNACEYYCVNDNLAVAAALAEPDAALRSLREKMVEIIAEVGIDTQQQDFKPHVTLGRMSTACPYGEPEGWPAINLMSLADSVALYQSKMGDNGPVYTPLFQVPLTAAPSEEN